MIAKPSKFERDVAKWTRQRAKDKQKRQAERLARVEWQLTCNAIYRRDGGCCRVCGRSVKRVSADPSVRAETHHIVYRSAGGSDDESNLILCCGECHFLEHQHRIEITGNGDGVVRIRVRNEAGTVRHTRESPCLESRAV